MSLNADTAIGYLRQQMVAWNSDEPVLFIGARESEVCNALVMDNPTLQVLPMNAAAEYLRNQEGNLQRRLVLIEDGGCDGEKLRPLLAKLRDTVGGRLILWSEKISLSEALALGFRRLNRTPYLFVFDLSDYKQKPDWFNPDHFAHPARWGLFVE